jgi:hypothetical protein
MSASAAHSPARPRAARRWSGPIRFRPTGDGRARRDDNADPQTSTGSDFRFEPGQFGWLLSVVRRLRSPSIRFSFSSSAACCGRWPIGKTPDRRCSSTQRRVGRRRLSRRARAARRPAQPRRGARAGAATGGLAGRNGLRHGGGRDSSRPADNERSADAATRIRPLVPARTGGCERRRRNEDSRAADWPSDRQGVGAYGVKPSRSRRPDGSRRRRRRRAARLRRARASQS